MVEQIIRPAAPASGRVTPASFPFFTTGEDNLRITSWNAAAGVKLKINARTIDPAGKVIPDSWDHTPNTDRSSKSSDLTLSGSTLLNLTVFAGAGSPQIGQTYVIVQLIRGIGTAALVLGTLLSGVVTATQALGFPGSTIAASTDGEPTPRIVVGSQPAAGGEILETVPAGARWELVTLSTRFTEAGGVSAIPKLVFDDGAGHEMCSIDAVVGAATTTLTYSWMAGLGYAPTGQNGLRVGTALPIGLRLLAGHRIRTITTLLAGADQYTAPVMLVREWLEAT